MECKSEVKSAIRSALNSVLSKTSEKDVNLLTNEQMLLIYENSMTEIYEKINRRLTPKSRNARDLD